MSNDLKILKQLEKEIGCEFKIGLGDENVVHRGYWHDPQAQYEFDQKNNITKIVINGWTFPEIPQSLFDLKKLKFLSLANNRLKEIPPDISRLPNLQRLNLCKNELTSLPTEIIQHTKLKNVFLSLNNLERPPQSIANKGIEAIRNYFQEIEEHGEEFIYEGKLILVGEPGAGKTSLTEKLLDPNYKLNPQEEMTKGIDVKRWHFQCSHNTDFRTNIWDFGGQDIMHATHRYFLTQRSLYCLIADNRKEDTDFFYWLNMLELFSGNSPVIIVLNEKFTYKKYVPENILKQFNCVQKVCNINLDDNTGLSDLADLIQQQMAQLPHVGTEPIPKKWVRIREALEKETRDYISRDEFLGICKQHDIKEEKKALYISGFLHDLGVVLHFQADLLLRNTVILNTRWATEAVYMILFDPTVIGNGGEFDNKDLERVWNVSQYKNKYADLLQLMINFKICYEIGDSRKYIIPELLPEKPPTDNYPPEFRAGEKQDLMHFEYRYDFMPKGITSRLIVKMNKHIDDGLQWKDGMILKINGAKVEIIQNFYQKVLKIRISGKGKNETLAIIRNQIKNLHDETFDNLEPDEMIPCNCLECVDSDNPHFFEYGLLKKYEGKGIPDIRCDISLENVEVLPLIKDIRAFENLLSSRSKSKIFISYSHKDKKWLERVQTHLKVLELEGIDIDVWDDTKIKASDKWQEEIKKALATAKIAILLITTDFLASEFIVKNELPPFLEAAENDGVKIIPLIIKPSMFEQNKTLSQFQAINDPSKPLIKLPEGDQEEILVKLATDIKDYIK